MLILEQLAFAAVFALRLQRKKTEKWQKIMIGVLLLLMGILFLYTLISGGGQTLYEGGERALQTIIGSTFFCSLLFLLVTVLLYLLFEISPFEALYTAICAYMGEHIAFCMRVLAEQATGWPVTNGSAWIVYLLINALVAFLCYREFAVPMIHEKHYAAPPHETIRLLLVAALVIMVLSTISGVFQFQTLHAVYALVFCIFVLYSQVERQTALARQSEADIREQMLISQKAQYESYRANVDLVNRKCHDLKHQVEALKRLGEGEYRQKAIRDIENSVLIYDSFIKTGNEGLDTILTQKNLLCVEKEILFTCVADGTLLDFMDPVDLYVFFGNLMDNAIEAVQVLPGEQRSIQLSVTQKKGMILIREENPTVNRLKVEQGIAQTTKEDTQNHGFGLRSIQLVAEKYEGSVSFKIEEGVYSLSAVFVI